MEVATEKTIKSREDRMEEEVHHPVRKNPFEESTGGEVDGDEVCGDKGKETDEKLLMGVKNSENENKGVHSEDKVDGNAEVESKDENHEKNQVSDGARKRRDGSSVGEKSDKLHSNGKKKSDKRHSRTREKRKKYNSGNFSKSENRLGV